MHRLIGFIGLLLLDAANVVAQEYAIYKGIVRDADTRRRLANINVFVTGTDIGTVSNEDGTFSLKLNRDSVSSGVEFSCMGYVNLQVPLAELDKRPDKVVAYLTPAINLLSEVTVYGGDAREIVKEAVGKIEQNYPRHANMLHTFYRETVRKGNRFIGISEGVLDVYKRGYGKLTSGTDRIRINRSRRLMSQKTSDTLAVKVEGGPYLAVAYDIVKNGEILFDDETLPLYDFRHEHFVMLDDHLHFVIHFTSRVVRDYPLFTGLLYIDSRDLCITRAEVSLDLSDREKAERALLQKKPAGLRFRPREATTLVSYRRHDDRMYIDYVRNTLRFKCDWKRRLFSSTYTTVAEMVVVDLDNAPLTGIPASEAFGIRQLFYDKARQNWDGDFWKDYNIIEPTESLEKAVEKLRKQSIIPNL